VRPSLLWLASYLFHPSGHADEARAFLRALELHGSAPAAREYRGRKPRPLDDPRLNVQLTETDHAMLLRQLTRTPAEPCVAVHHYVPRASRRPLPGTVNVARAMFETDRIPASWKHLLERFHEVWVPCRHNYEVFAAGGVAESKLRVIGETLDFDRFRPGLDPERSPLPRPGGHFTFLSNFDFSERKGWRELLLAWARAFHPNDPVCLVLKTGSVAQFDGRFARDRIARFLRRRCGRRGTAPVRVIARMLPADVVPRLYAAADAYVSASRGEAWGRPYMEAMAMGLPTIGTRYGGNLDFMSDDNSWLVEGSLVPVPDEAAPNHLYLGHRWFKADVDALSHALQDVAGNPSAARRKAAQARSQLINRFGPQRIARVVLDSAFESAQEAGA
jgi:glycosyltransferase involved in cell wall biosynthesis